MDEYSPDTPWKLCTYHYSMTGSVGISTELATTVLFRVLNHGPPSANRLNSLHGMSEDPS